ncbi:MAG TPA: response regulator transcription factor [Verrucomicrobiae bacterium]|nr:response regulator transcription factor [Verrucomicrobiae bacterium]
MTKLRVLVADDHEVVRAGVRSLLEDQPDCDVCGEAVTGREAVTLAQQLRPDIVVLDITMPELNGLEAARQILKSVPNVQVLILSVHESEELIREIVEIGAHGYILKSDAGRELAAAIRALGQRESYFTSKVAQIALRAYLNKQNGVHTPSSPDGTLTPREREVLQLLAEGKSNKEVASTLGISVMTAETHRANIMHKLGAHSVAELVHYAVRHKMITP